MCHGGFFIGYLPVATAAQLPEGDSVKYNITITEPIKPDPFLVSDARPKTQMEFVGCRYRRKSSCRCF